MQNLVDSLNLLIWGCVQNNYHRPNKTDSTAQLAQSAQFLLEEIRPQHSTDENTERSQGSDENSRREGIGSKVAYLTSSDYILVNTCSVWGGRVPYVSRCLPTTRGSLDIRSHLLRIRGALLLVSGPVRMVSVGSIRVASASWHPGAFRGFEPFSL